MNATSVQPPLGNLPPPHRANERGLQKAELQPIRGLRPKLLYERYGIVENPFGVTPNPRYLYESRTHAEARSSLFVGIEYRVGFQALIAPPGMGKTTILFNLLERFNNVARTAFLFQTHGDSRDFLRYLISELGGEAADSDLVRMQDTLNQLLIREHRASRQTIVIVDEAQSLDTSVLETLRLLSNFETPTEKLLQIILAGQPQLAQRLASPELAQLYQRISIRATLIPFDLEDTRNYIEHRLKIAGYRGPPLFTPAAVRSILERSGGVPREINTLCFNALLLATAVAQKQVDSDILHEVVADLDLNPMRFNTDTPPRSMPSVQIADVLGLADAAGDPPATSIDQTRKAAVPGSETKAGDVYTRPTVSDGVELVQLETIEAKILPASCRERSAQTAVRRVEAEADDVTASAALPDRPALTSDRKTDAVMFAATRVVGVPSCETEATGNSTEVPLFTPHGPDAHGANDSTIRTHQKPPSLTNSRWIGTIAALVIVSSFMLGLIIRNPGKRNVELPSISRTEAPRKPKAAGIPKVAQGLTDKQYPAPPLGQQKTGGAQDAPFRTPQHNRRGVNRTNHTTTGTSAGEIVVSENLPPGTAVDESSGQLPNTGKIANTEDDATSVSKSLMSKVSGVGVNDHQAPNSTVRRTTTDSNPGEAVVEENSAPGTAVDKSSGKLPKVDKVLNTEDKADSLSEGVVSGVPAAGIDSRAGAVANIVPARLIRKVKPIYPPAALEAQIQGSVVLQVLVGQDGAVRDARFLSGPPVLIPAAIDAVKHWQYQPSSVNGQPIEWETQVALKFELR